MTDWRFYKTTLSYTCVTGIHNDQQPIQWNESAIKWLTMWGHVEFLNLCCGSNAIFCEFPIVWRNISDDLVMVNFENIEQG